MTNRIYNFIDPKYMEKLRPIQRNFFDTVYSKWNEYDVFVFHGPTACHAKGQKVLLFDGSTKEVEHVRVGDLLMGPDSKPRKVLDTHTGVDKLLKIIPTIGEPWVVQQNHLLYNATYVKKGKRPNRKMEIQYNIIQAKDYNNMSKTYKHCTYQTMASVEFSEKSLPVPPYILGLWLGDGSAKQPAITTMETEVVDVWTDYAHSLGLNIRKETKPDNLAATYFASVAKNNGLRNPFLTLLRNLNVYDNKHIPQLYLTSSKAQRLELVAGLLDTDGYIDSGRRSFEISTCYKHMCEQMLFLFRSVGLSANSRVKSINGKDYYIITGSSGEEVVPPCRVPRRALPVSRSNQRNSSFKIEDAGVGEFYGFEVDGDHLYLLDSFVITHNSGKSVCSTSLAKWRKSLEDNVAIITPKVMLQDQYSDEFPSIGCLKGRARYTCNDSLEGNCDSHFQVEESYCPGCPYKETRDAINREGLGIFNFYSYMLGSFEADTLIIDEAHNTFDAVSEMYTKYIYKCVEKYKNIETLGDAIIFLENKCMLLRAELAEIVGDPDYKARIVEIKKEIEHNYRMIAGVQESPKDFFFEKVETTYRGKKTEALRLQPLTLNSIGRFLFGNSSKIILMSGTINSIDIRKLGLGNRKVLEVHGQSPIPRERRPIIYEPAANMAFANQHIAIPKLAERIKELAASNQEKGLVHTTYAIAEKLKPYLSDDDRFLFHSKENKDAVYAKFRSSDKPYILVASGMAEGIDLPYEAGRWQIITKIQYPSLADNLMMYVKNNEKDLYAWMTVRTLVQQCGRICRTPEDYGVTYILDTCFENLYKFNKKLFPQYFKESVQFKLSPSKGA